jgi:acyl dehydratase
VTALVRVGPPNGMVVDPEWANLAPYAERLIADGFGYSAVSINGEPSSMVEVLKDWGWVQGP